MAPRAERPDMAAYGVPDEVEGVLPWEWAEDRLLRSRRYWLTTVTEAGRPHCLPVWGVWLTDPGRFWFSCATTARKARNLRAAPSIVVAPDDAVEVVSLEGRAVEVTGGDVGDAVQAYWEKYGEEMGMAQPGVAEFLRSNAAFEVVPERAFGIIERPEEFSRRATRWRW